MKLVRTLFLLVAITGCNADAGETTSSKQSPPLTPLDDRWRFSLSTPGWLAGLEGDVGIDGVISAIDVSPADIIRRIDMAAMLRAEAIKGRFGVTGDFIYLSLSDGIGTTSVVKKLDLQVDEIIGDLGLRWRVIEGERGYLDVTAGVRYVNLYQKLALQPDSARIGEASTNLVDEVGRRLRTALSESGLRDVIAQQLGTRLAVLDGRNPTLPIGPLGGRDRTPILDRVRQIIEARKAELTAALRDRAQAATDALRARAQARVDGIKRDVSHQISRTLESKLDRTVSRTDDWFDPYIGLRGRYNFTDRLYVTAKGDVGGFGIGSDFTWQAEAAFGWQLTHRIFAEAGYRALGIDYEDNGLTYNTITHGAQITLGISF
jgi:hypothetical protein